jgi:hypothetical protein
VLCNTDNIIQLTMNYTYAILCCFNCFEVGLLSLNEYLAVTNVTGDVGCTLTSKEPLIILIKEI